MARRAGGSATDAGTDGDEQVHTSIRVHGNYPVNVYKTTSHPEMVGDMSRVTLTLTDQKFLLHISSHGQDLYSHQN